MLLVLLGLLLVGAVGVVEVPQWLSPAPSQTIWQTITAGIQDGTVPKQTALEAFAYVYKVDIPGVTLPQGTDAGDEPTSGSGVMRWVQANWNGLTPDQQAVINRYLAPASQSQTIPVTPAATAGTSAGAAKPVFQLDKAYAWPIPVDIAPDAPLDLAQAMANELVSDIAHIGPRLGIPVIAPGSRASPEHHPDVERHVRRQRALSDRRQGAVRPVLAVQRDRLEERLAKRTGHQQRWRLADAPRSDDP